MLQVLVTRKWRIAEGICAFELCLASGDSLPPFTAGAHVDVHLPSGMVRQYSLCNAPQERHHYLIGVLKDPASRGGSRAMHEWVEQGQVLHISEPRNGFPLAADGATHLLIAGGIGITPMLAMAHELERQGSDFELHYCFRSRDRAAFLEALETAPFADRTTLHDDSSAVPSTLDARALLQSPQPGRHLYVCGPGGFMDYVLGCANAAGWPQQQVHREFFAGAPIDDSANLAFEVKLARSGRILQIPADRSVLEVLDEAGIEIETSCEQGICGACITRVLQGIPDHRDQFMSAAEHASNDHFTPCCSRAKSPSLVLDL